MKKDPIETALASLDEIDPNPGESRQQLAKALGSRFNLVTAKAARMAASAQRLDLLPDLAAAFGKYLSGRPADKGCAALTALARALVTLDYDGAELFRRGAAHIQMEPVWGGSVDTAADLRGACAMGLANSSNAGKLRDLIPLLVDSCRAARSGAIRALAAVGSPDAALLLRYKGLLGDEDTEVVSDCVLALLNVEGADALPIATRLAESNEPETREAAILALGESRREDAIEYLKQRFESVADRDTRKCIVLALAASRGENATGFLLNLIREGSDAMAALVSEAMSVYRADAQFASRIAAAEQERGRARARH